MRDFLRFHYIFMRDFSSLRYTFMRDFSRFHHIFMRRQAGFSGMGKGVPCPAAGGFPPVRRRSGRAEATGSPDSTVAEKQDNGHWHNPLKDHANVRYPPSDADLSAADRLCLFPFPAAAYSHFIRMSHTATMWQTLPASTKKWKTVCMKRRLLRQ